jgi:hypothetical protein
MSLTQASRAVTVVAITLIDPSHHNGDRFCDGDQTLWEATLEEAGQRRAMLFVVARGNAFIPAEVVTRRIEALVASCDQARPILPQLDALAAPPEPRRRPQIRLVIDPAGT